MSSKVETAVAQRDEELVGITRMIEHYSGDYARVLPSHIPPGTFVRLAQGLLRRDPKLAAAAKENPNSLLAALLECAELGHRPGSDQYALTWRSVQDPPKSGRKVKTIVGIEQYQGEIERMYRAGGVLAVKARVVRENDFYDFNEATMVKPDHRPGYYVDSTSRHQRFAGAEARGRLVAVYAYAEMQGGAVSRVVEMDREEVMDHRAAAATTVFWDGPWEPSMWLKTAIHELEKWVPTSSEYLRDRARAMAEAQSTTRERSDAAEPAPPTTLEGAIVEDDQVKPDPAAWPDVTQPPDQGGEQ